MESLVIQEFQGMINGIFIREKRVYYSVLFILENISRHWGECYTKEFIKDLAATIQKSYDKNLYFCFTTFEEGICFNVTCFQKLSFHYDGEKQHFESLNKNIQAGIYSN